MAISNWPGVACQTAYAPLDMLGVNEYIGWFDAGGGSTDDRDVLGPWLDGLRACYPTKPLMVTEFGFEGNRHGPVEERGTYEFQADNANFHLGVFASKPWLSGALWFAMQTFAAHPGWGGGDPFPDPPWVQKGAYDQYGQPTPLFDVLSGIYHATVQIAPSPTAPARCSEEGGSPPAAAAPRCSLRARVDFVRRYSTATHGPLRPSRRGRREARPVRRMGDADPVRGRQGRASRRPTRGRHLRRLAHGGDRDPRARCARVSSADALQRHPPPPGGRRAVQRAVPRGRRRSRRPLHVSHRRVRASSPSRTPRITRRTCTGCRSTRASSTST